MGMGCGIPTTLFLTFLLNILLGDDRDGTK